MTVYISLFPDYPIKESCPLSNGGERHKWGVSARMQVSKTACQVRGRETALLPNPSRGRHVDRPPHLPAERRDSASLSRKGSARQRQVCPGRPGVLGTESTDSETRKRRTWKPLLPGLRHSPQNRSAAASLPGMAGDVAPHKVMSSPLTPGPSVPLERRAGHLLDPILWAGARAPLRR